MSAALRIVEPASRDSVPPSSARPAPLQSGIQELLAASDQHAAQLRRLEDAFVECWGRMAESFAMNRALGRVHALVYVSLAPISSAEIAERLISTAEACDALLGELLAYRVIRAVQGTDGVVRFEAELDPWSWFHRTVRERRQREFMPVQRQMRELLAHARAFSASAPREHAPAMHLTLERIERFTSFVEDGARLMDAFIALGGGAMTTLMRTVARFMPRSRLEGG